MGSLLVDDATKAMTAGAEALFATQRPDGVFDHGTDGWTSVLATVGATTALRFADPDGSADLVAAGVDWLCHVQDPAGSWSNVPGVPAEPGVTAVTAAALHLLAPERAAASVEAGRAWLQGMGGIEALPHEQMIGLCRQFYALAGWVDESELRRIPLELALFPRLLRKVADFRMPLVAAFGLAQVRQRRQSPPRRLLNRPAGKAALGLLRQIYDHEGRTGEFGNDPWPAGMICGALARADVAPDLVGASAGWLRSRANPDGSWPMMALDLTWSGNAAAGLIEAGHGDDPRLARTLQMFRDRHQDRPFTAFGCPPGFWSWCGAQGWPDAWVTAEIISALAHPSAALGGPSGEHVRRGVGWLTAQQDGRGSWGFCVRNSKSGNTGACPVTTAEAVSALLASGVPADDKRIRRAVRWLLDVQRPDGSYDAQWYRPYTAATAIVLETLAGTLPAESPAVRRARDWLVRTQLDDGGWSAGDGTGPATVEETAWALRAVLVAGLDTGDPQVRRGVDHLMRAQGPDGHWPAAPVSEYIRYITRFPNGALTGGLALRALARFRTAAARGAGPTREGLT